MAWFSALCPDDYRYLGIPDNGLKSSWQHCTAIVKKSEKNGFRNIFCPSSYQIGQDTLSFVAVCASITDKINLLAAIRCGEMQSIMLARTIATLDHTLQGCLTINIISSNFPGQKEENNYRYQRLQKVVQILQWVWTQDEINFDGQIYQLHGLTTAPAKPYHQNGEPLLYFGGYSPAALDLCARFCDVYLMWPEPKNTVIKRMQAVAVRAKECGRTLDYGLRPMSRPRNRNRSLRIRCRAGFQTGR